MTLVTSCFTCNIVMSIMQALHLSSVDLNLAVVLHAVLAEQSVSRAAKRLGLSQSATSHALARLRDAVGDRLVLRTRDGLVPTPRARAMAEPLAAAMSLLEAAFVAKREFDPKSAKHRFSVMGTDYAEIVLLPALVEDLGAHAPNVELRMQPMTRDALTMLRRRDVEMVIGVFPEKDLSGDLRSTVLLEDRLVCVVRKGHPLLRKKLTLARYAAAKHVLVSPRGTPGGIVDDALASRGVSRTVAVTVPHFLAAPHLVAKTDLVLTVAERAARVFVRSLPLEILSPPLDLPRTKLSLVWHRDHDADPAHTFLRDRVCTHCASTVRARG